MENNNNQVPTVDDVFGTQQPNNGQSDIEIVQDQPEVQSVQPSVEVQSQVAQPEVQNVQPSVEVQPQVAQPEAQSIQPSVEVQPQVVQPEVQSVQPSVEVQPQVAQPEVQSVQPTVEVQPQVVQPEVQSVQPTVEVQPQVVQPEVQSVQPSAVVAAPIATAQVVQEQPSMTTTAPTVDNQAQPQVAPSTTDDEALLKSFVGPNFEKISGRPINFAAFFFSSLYMFYRKMYVYAIVLTLISNLLIAFLPEMYYLTLIINIAALIAFNPLYMKYANSKVNEIKTKNQGKSQNELMEITRKQGGVSTANIFIGIVVSVIFSIGINTLTGNKAFNMFNFATPTSNSSSKQSSNSNTIDNVTIQGHGCINSKCNVTIVDSNNNSKNYNVNLSNQDLFLKLGRYDDNLTINISVDANDTIVGYKLIMKSTNEDISNVSTEEELRAKLGLYSLGEHTEKLTLKEIGSTGFGTDEASTYSYATYTFTNDKGVDYEMKYIIDEYELLLEEGTQYEVTFEVTEGTFDYSYTIKTVTLVLD